MGVPPYIFRRCPVISMLKTSYSIELAELILTYKRLRSSSKSFKEVAKKRIVLSTPILELSTPTLRAPILSTPTTIVNSNATNEQLLICSSIVVEENSFNTSHINLNTVAQVASTSARTKRVDNLS